MLLSLEINGYRFFDNLELSFCADARIKRLFSNSVEIDSKNILKSVGIYGGNNSGKTNIVKLFAILKDVLLGKGDINFNNSIFDDPENTKVSLIFNNGNGWYKYCFIYSNIKHQYEYELFAALTYYSRGSCFEKKLFEKDNESRILKIHDEDLSHYLDIIPSRLPLLYSVEIEKGTFELLKTYLDELQKFANSIDIIEMYNIPIRNTVETMKSNDDVKKDFINKFVKNADISIDNFEYNDSVRMVDDPVINEAALQQYANILDPFKLVTTYNNKRVPSIIYDSTGTKKIEAIASYIYDAIKECKLLIIDELDNGLHFKLTRAIIALFNNLLNEKGQLLFITHDLLLIDSKTLMRKDQVYFINRNQEKATLFPLREYTVESGGPREVNELIKHYNHGEFGKVPDPDFIDLLAGVLNG